MHVDHDPFLPNLRQGRGDGQLPSSCGAACGKPLTHFLAPDSHHMCWRRGQAERAALRLVPDGKHQSCSPSLTMIAGQFPLVSTFAARGGPSHLGLISLPLPCLPSVLAQPRILTLRPLAFYLVMSLPVVLTLKGG